MFFPRHSLFKEQIGLWGCSPEQKFWYHGVKPNKKKITQYQPQDILQVLWFFWKTKSLPCFLFSTAGSISLCSFLTDYLCQFLLIQLISSILETNTVDTVQVNFTSVCCTLLANWFSFAKSVQRGTITLKKNTVPRVWVNHFVHAKYTCMYRLN